MRLSTFLVIFANVFSPEVKAWSPGEGIRLNCPPIACKFQVPTTHLVDFAQTLYRDMKPEKALLQHMSETTFSTARIYSMANKMRSTSRCLS